MTDRLEAALTFRQHAWRLRGMARELEPRLAADLLRIALDLDKEAIEIESAVYAKQNPASVA